MTLTGRQLTQRMGWKLCTLTLGIFTWHLISLTNLVSWPITEIRRRDRKEEGEEEKEGEGREVGGGRREDRGSGGGGGGKRRNHNNVAKHNK